MRKTAMAERNPPHEKSSRERPCEDANRARFDLQKGRPWRASEKWRKLLQALTFLSCRSRASFFAGRPPCLSAPVTCGVVGGWAAGGG